MFTVMTAETPPEHRQDSSYRDSFPKNRETIDYDLDQVDLELVHKLITGELTDEAAKLISELVQTKLVWGLVYNRMWVQHHFAPYFGYEEWKKDKGPSQTDPNWPHPG
jgi:hypothetical protein